MRRLHAVWDWFRGVVTLPPETPEPAFDRCPYCHTTDQMDWFPFQTEGYEAWQAVYCSACETAWHEVYLFSHIDLDAEGDDATSQYAEAGLPTG